MWNKRGSVHDRTATVTRNSADVSVGAVTFGSGTQGVNGTVSSTNSLVGTTERDLVGNIDDTTSSWSPALRLDVNTAPVMQPLSSDQPPQRPTLRWNELLKNADLGHDVYQCSEVTRAFEFEYLITKDFGLQ